VRVAHAARWSPAAARRARAAGRWSPAVLAFATFAGAAALAGPRWGEERVLAETRGLSLVVAVDISRSMLAEDASPTRLARAIREARRVVQDLEGDRVGLIAFAGASYILSPLSVDGSALALYLDALDPEIASAGGTSLVPALRQGGELLGAATELSDRVLVVFTDGEAHDSIPEAFAVAAQLRASGVRLVVVAEGAGDARRGRPAGPGGRGAGAGGRHATRRARRGADGTGPRPGLDPAAGRRRGARPARVDPTHRGADRGGARGRLGPRRGACAGGPGAAAHGRGAGVGRG
jgi:Mg-chelatase subunit ChlD